MARSSKDEWAGRAYLLLSLVIVVWYYAPLLAPLTNPDMVFSSGDFYASPGPGSAASRFDLSFFTYNLNQPTDGTVRSFLAESPSAITRLFGMTDSQTYSILILAALILGVVGMHRICAIFPDCPRPMAVVLSAFYFTNLWGVERIGHTWIWLTFAVMPLFFFLGVAAAGGSRRSLATYALVFAFYGMVPHSFIYLLAWHVGLALYAGFNGRNPKAAALFFLLPLAVWLAANLPVFMLFREAISTYPMDTSAPTLELLSSNGEPLNILSMANNWFQQLPKPVLLWNATFRATSMAVVGLAFTMAALAYGKAGRGPRMLVAICVLWLGGTMLAAGGMNNPAISLGVDALSDHGGGWLVGPFREWGRVMLLAPLAVCVIAAAGAGAPGGRAGIAVAAAFGLAVLLNFLASPAPQYMDSVYAPVEMPRDYAALKAALEGTGKTLWVLPTGGAEGTPRYLWNRSKIATNVLDDFGSSYYDFSGIMQLMKVREAPTGLLDAMDIGNVVFRSDRTDLGGFFVDYEWLQCEAWDYFTVCRNANRSGEVRAYAGSVFCGNDAETLYSLAHADGLGPAPSSKIDASTRAVVVQDEEAAVVSLAGGLGSKTAPMKGRTEWRRLSSQDKERTFRAGGSLAGDVREVKSAYFTNRNNSIATLPFSVDGDGTYVVLGRVLMGGWGGRVGLAMDGDYIGSVETFDDRWGFRWVRLAEPELEAGRHELRITSQYGLNAVYGVLVLRKDIYDGILSKLDEAYRTKSNIIILEAEEAIPDAGREYVKTEKVQWASRGQAVRFLKEKPVDLQVEVKKEGNYTLKVNCKGTMMLELEGRVFRTMHNGSGLLEVADVHLVEGTHNITISAEENGMVDVIWLYEDVQGTISGDGQPPAEIGAVEMIDLTRVMLKANASAPFLLHFAENARYGWEARVRKGGAEVARVAPATLFGVSSGYWINETGELDIEMRYPLQDRFELGLLVSGAAIAACAAFAIGGRDENENEGNA